MDLEVVPFGNAFYTTQACPYNTYSHDGIMCWINSCDKSTAPADCFEGETQCQHGPNECVANRIEACAIGMYGEETGVKFVQCLEKAYTSAWRSAAGKALVLKAAMSCSGNDQELMKCFNGDQGDRFQANFAQKTVELGTAKKGTPWVLIDGKQSATDNLVQKICEAYKGTPKPAACSKFSSGNSLCLM